MMTKQDRAERTRQALVFAAAEVFNANGFAPSSLSMISSRAGVSNGALHFHFVNKSALAEEVENRALAALRQITRPRAPGPDRLLQRLVDTTHLLSARLGEDVILRAGFGLSSDPTRQGRPDLRQHWADWVDDLLKGAAGEGSLAEGVVPEDAGAVIAATTVGFEALGRIHPRWFSRQMFSSFWRLLLPRLAAGPALNGLAPEGSSELVRAAGQAPTPGETPSRPQQ